MKTETYVDICPSGLIFLNTLCINDDFCYALIAILFEALKLRRAIRLMSKDVLRSGRRLRGKLGRRVDDKGVKVG